MAKKGVTLPVYSDSSVAIGWVRKKIVRSKSMLKGKTSPRVDDLVTRALQWLKSNSYENEILKWETAAWGEIPADYGRK